MLETKNLTKQFGNLTAVDDVSLEIEETGIDSVIGPNGAGKSTFFHLLTGYLQPTQGQIRYRGEEITGLPPRKIVEKGISRSFQIVDLFGGLSVRKNVQIATQSLDENRNALWRDANSLTETVERTETLLADLGLMDVADMRADSLSYGNQRVLEIGLAIGVEPELLLLDEPTAGMGKDESVKTFNLIREIAADRGIKLILIEHDIEIIMEISDTITVLDRGRILARGPPEAIQANQDVQEAYIGTGE